MTTALWRLYVDGASRNNPGNAGVGFVLLHGAQIICHDGFYVGTMTNNSAEYLALIIGLLYAQQQVPAGQIIAIYADSQLLIRQLLGEYAIKQPHLQHLASVAQQLLQPYRAELYHVVREHNKRADALANHGVDEKKLPPATISNKLHHMGIVLPTRSSSL
ncbi:ribonuclease HI family protein [Candidatus Dependentiae bacterium]|nr:ribonuclease HI family protein [Candidatus Dependentiae bacterium]